jgi:cell shape-determining protein MreC
VVELSDSLREKTAQVETLNRQVRLLKEENQQLAQRNEELEERAESGPQVASGEGSGGSTQFADMEGFEPENVIRGRVTNTLQRGNDQFIALNVGTNDRVRKGMQFMIHRGDQFLGNAVVIEPDQNQSIARVTLQKGEITRDAQVQTGGRQQQQ